MLSLARRLRLDVDRHLQGTDLRRDTGQTDIDGVLTGVVPRRSTRRVSGRQPLRLRSHDRHQRIGDRRAAGEWAGQLVARRRTSHVCWIVRGAFRVDQGTGSDRSGWIEPHATDARRRIRLGLRLVTERQRDRVRPQRWRRVELDPTGADGSNATRLTYGAGLRGGINWSPDSERIAFNCGTTICAINRDGTNLVQLAPAGSYASTAIFSPVGGDMAFLNGGLKVMRADGSIIAVAPGVYATGPAWSPDGRSLAFVVPGAPESSGGACNGDGSPCGRTPDYTYAVDADGTGLRPLAFGSNPAWFVPLPGQPAAAFTTTCAEERASSTPPGRSIRMARS